MTPELINRARIFRDAYAELLAAWRADEAPTLDRAMEICYNAYRAEYNFLFEITNEVSGNFNPNPILRRLLYQITDIIGIPEMFSLEEPEWRPGLADVPDGQDKGEQRAARAMLWEGVLVGTIWVETNNPDTPLTVGGIYRAADWLNKWLESVKASRQESPKNLRADIEPQEDITRNIPRSQSIALLYAVFVRLRVTQTYSDTAVARLIEAITGGKIRNGKNSYAWKHRNDKLQPDVEELLNEFMNGGQSPE